MKKLLLCSAVMLGFISAQAQDQFYWEEKSTGFSNTSTTMSHISYADANTVWICAADGSGGGGTYRNWGRSLDGGSTWTNGVINLGSNDLGIGSIQAISATTAYVAGFPNAATAQGGVWITTNSGATWTRQNTALFNTADSFANFVYFWNANVGICQGDPSDGYFEIYVTTNGGTTWTRVPSGNLPTPEDGEYGYVHNFDVVGNTIWFGTNKGRIYKNTNQGNGLWTVAQSPIADFGSAAISGNYTFKDQNEGLLISSDWQFFRTTDGAATWNPEVPNGTYRNFNVDFVPGAGNYVVCTGEDLLDGLRGSSYSTDGGLNWEDINLIDLDPVDGGGALAFYDATHGLASGFTTSSTVGGIWKWINDASMANVDFQSTHAYTVSPNPTSGEIQINGQKIAQVTVFDILGKQVFNANYGALNNVSVNLSSLNSGVYMVKVSNDAGASSTVKVIKQ